jgi:hypothetical protein
MSLLCCLVLFLELIAFVYLELQLHFELFYLVEEALVVVGLGCDSLFWVIHRFLSLRAPLFVCLFFFLVNCLEIFKRDEDLKNRSDIIRAS